jgi:lysophospholipase L1-like esterase
MKFSFIALFFCTITAFMPASKKKRIVFFGDSITAAGAKPGGYIMKMDSMLVLQGKAEQYELMGAGVSGNKVYDLYLRMEEDVLAKEPDIVVIYIGVNDVWHKRTSGTGTDPDKFEKFYQAIISKLKAKNINVILCTPAMIGEKTDSSNPLDGDLNEYSKIIRNIAQKNSLPVVDLRRAFLDYGLKNNQENKTKDILTNDGVHLNAKGNQFVADEMWKVIQAY